MEQRAAQCARSRRLLPQTSRHAPTRRRLTRAGRAPGTGRFSNSLAIRASSRQATDPFASVASRSARNGARGTPAASHRSGSIGVSARKLVGSEAVSASHRSASLRGTASTPPGLRVSARRTLGSWRGVQVAPDAADTSDGPKASPRPDGPAMLFADDDQFANSLRSLFSIHSAGSESTDSLQHAGYEAFNAVAADGVK